jgi:hypothetical protein
LLIMIGWIMFQGQTFGSIGTLSFSEASIVSVLSLVDCKAGFLDKLLLLAPDVASSPVSYTVVSCDKFYFNSSHFLLLLYRLLNFISGKRYCQSLPRICPYIWRMTHVSRITCLISYRVKVNINGVHIGT